MISSSFVMIMYFKRFQATFSKKKNSSRPRLGIKQLSFRNDKRTEVEMRPATVSGTVAVDALKWPILVIVPEVFAQVNSALLPSISFLKWRIC